MKPAVIVALGTGMRMSEQLRMKRRQVDFLRNIVTARNTKNGRPRDIPMNDDVRDALAELCKNKRPDAYVFVNPKTKSCLQENENSFSYSLPTCWNRKFDLEGSAGNFRNPTGRSGLRRLHDRTTSRTLRCWGDYALREDG
jgi:integrase